jgi:kumamolisin
MESVRRPHPEAVLLGSAPAHELLLLSIYLAETCTPEEVKAAADALRAQGLEVVESSSRRHVLVARATVATIEAAFSCRILRLGPEPAFLAPDAEPVLPVPLASLATALLGLDTSPAGRRMLITRATPSVSYTPIQVAEAYRFPSADLTGHHLAIIELGGGLRRDDLAAYFASLGQPTPTVQVIDVDGGTSAPTTPSSADAEVMLDIEIAGSVAHGAAIDVYFAPNTEQGFVDAVSIATTGEPAPDAVSISWGSPETTWSPAGRTQLAAIIAQAAARGVTVTVAAGDQGAADGLSDGLAHVDFPAAAPAALGCGGTRLTLTNTGGIASQTVWNDLAIGDGATGGGVSRIFPLPAYQEGFDVPPSVDPGHARGRGVPDVAANADPDTGYRILVNGNWITVGGTSAVAPLIAALVTRLNAARGTRLGLAQDTWYPLARAAQTSDAPAFLEVTQGSNGAYSAHPGWNACAGLGSPIGERLASGPTS